VPAVNRDLYPGSTYDLSYGGAGFSWATPPGPALINDAVNNPTDPTWGLWNPSFATPRTAYAEFRLAPPPLGIVSITNLWLVAWVMATGTSGTYDTDVSAMVRPSGVGTGATGVHFSSPIVLTSSSGANEVYSEKVFAAWAVNPDTSVPWTLSDLASLVIGLRFAAPMTDPVNNASIKLGRLRAVIDATSIAANTEMTRVVGSMPLNLFNRALPGGQIVGPELLADVGLLETFFLQHSRGRRPQGPGWGYKAWERRPREVTRKTVDFLSGQTTLQSIDKRRVYKRLWVPGITTLGHSLDGQGLPLLHSGGGGFAVVRDQVKYIERPGNPTDYVLQAVAENLLAGDRRGMVSEAGGDINLVLNSTLSQGAFDNWTSFTDGSGLIFAAKTGYGFGVDETGLRQGAGLGVGTTPASNAYLTQVVPVSTDFRLAIRTFNSSGTDRLSVVIQRSSDSKYWNDSVGSNGAWQVGIVYNRIGNDAGGHRRWFSRKPTSTGDDITIHIGYFGEGDDDDFGAYLWSVDLVEGTDHIGTDIVTTTDPITREADIISIRNEEAVRWWSFERGFSGVVTMVPFWDYHQLGTGEVRVILHVDMGDGNYSQIAFQRGVESVFDRFVFSAFWDSVAYTAEYVVDSDVLGHTDLEPLRDVPFKVSFRYIGPDAELDKEAFTIELAVNDDWAGGTPDVLPEVPVTAPVSTGYLGSTGTDGWLNGAVRQLIVSPLVLFDEELERLPS